MKEPIFYRIVRGPLAFWFKATFLPVVVGKENAPKSGKAVLAGNHASNFDCLLVACATKRCVHFLAKDELMKGPGKYLFKNLGIIPVNRRTKDGSALPKAKEFLNDGKLIGIFPEGTVNRTEDIIMPFKYGAVKMACDTGSPIVPFVISGRYRPFARSVKIKFLKPRTVSEDLEKANGELMKTVADELKKERTKK